MHIDIVVLIVEHVVVHLRARSAGNASRSSVVIGVNDFYPITALQQMITRARYDYFLLLLFHDAFALLGLHRNF